MAKKNTVRTSEKVAKKASDLLRDKRYGKKIKSVGGEALGNRRRYA